jgi:hypothetical protein
MTRTDGTMGRSGRTCRCAREYHEPSAEDAFRRITAFFASTWPGEPAGVRQLHRLPLAGAG